MKFFYQSSLGLVVCDFESSVSKTCLFPLICFCLFFIALIAFSGDSSLGLWGSSLPSFHDLNCRLPASGLSHKFFSLPFPHACSLPLDHTGLQWPHHREGHIFGSFSDHHQGLPGVVFCLRLSCLRKKKCPRSSALFLGNWTSFGCPHTVFAKPNPTICLFFLMFVDSSIPVK